MGIELSVGLLKVLAYFGVAILRPRHLLQRISTLGVVRAEGDDDFPTLSLCPGRRG